LIKKIKMAKKLNDLILENLDEVVKFSIKIRIFRIILNAIIVSLLFAILLRLFAIHAIISIFFGILYFILSLIYLSLRASLYRNDAIHLIVDRYPSMNERLQAAYDNIKKSNIIVDSLRSDVLKRFKKMYCSSFLDMGPIITRVFLSVILIFILLSINFIHFEGFAANSIPHGENILGDIINSIGFGNKRIDNTRNIEEFVSENFTTRERIEEDSIGGESGGQLPGISEGPIPGMGGGVGYEENPDIFGEPSSARIHGDNINMEIHPEYGGEIEIEDVEVEKRKLNRFEERLMGKSAEIPEQEPPEYSEIIRKYFQSLQNILKEK